MIGTPFRGQGAPSVATLAGSLPFGGDSRRRPGLPVPDTIRSRPRHRPWRTAAQSLPPIGYPCRMTDALPFAVTSMRLRVYGPGAALKSPGRVNFRPVKS